MVMCQLSFITVMNKYYPDFVSLHPVTIRKVSIIPLFLEVVPTRVTFVVNNYRTGLAQFYASIMLLTCLNGRKHHRLLKVEVK